MRDIAAGLVTALLCTSSALGLVLGLGVVRYEHELIVSVPTLFVVTMVFAGLSVPVGGFALFMLARDGFQTWIVFALCGSIVACAAAGALAVAADCVPHCKGGRGGLEAALYMAALAGFTAGALCGLAWRVVRNVR